ncbi:MAG: N-(5'-phosphoribosyl)anthranilate isomerase [Planctomycetaceae bacterium]|nr:N-(5'-phosphoribosyl)anthranilate isomerase [Planctomycetaceae bacterium]|tara:strand:+ start:596 stop:1267 length:672 start_codon:yes stop_codon:yes gene_type:complete
MFRIKICGITTVTHGRQAVEAGADAIGFNFFPESPRYVTPGQADAIVQAIPNTICRVGLFVNASLEDILATATQLRLDMIQLHGDETPEYVAQLRGHRIIAARRCPAGFDSVLSFVDQCQSRACIPEAILIDGYQSGQYGGTGQMADWDAVAALAGKLRGAQLILAGGLIPENVATAIHQVRPDAVDTASGVESKPGVKDRQKMQDFVTAAQGAFADHQRSSR